MECVNATSVGCLVQKTISSLPEKGIDLPKQYWVGEPSINKRRQARVDAATTDAELSQLAIDIAKAPSSEQMVVGLWSEKTWLEGDRVSVDFGTLIAAAVW